MTPIFTKRQDEPAVEPLSVADAKAHLRVIGTTDDAAIENYITAARRMVEDMTNRVLITIDAITGWHCWQTSYELPLAPANEVTLVEYLDITDTWQTLASSNYVVSVSEDALTRVILSSQFNAPELADAYNAHRPRVRITYKAGYGTTADTVPQPLQHAVKFLTAHLYDHRAPIHIGANVQRMPFAVEAITNRYKVHFT